VPKRLPGKAHVGTITLFEKRRLRMLWLRTVLFTVLVPGTELVLVPWVVVGLDVGPRLPLGPVRYLGLVPVLIGVVAILRCFVDFIHRGRGTPAIYDPPRELVVAGLYRRVRNPQYVGVVLVILGEALLTEMIVLFGYAALMAIGYHLFLRHYEEPKLGRLFGESYARYREAVPRWLPRRLGRAWPFS
jgi:protein-S-isoprenylcysteine O-methyltransferase Ste14